MHHTHIYIYIYYENFRKQWRKERNACLISLTELLCHVHKFVTVHKFVPKITLSKMCLEKQNRNDGLPNKRNFQTRGRDSRTKGDDGRKF